jgi:acetyl esterase/lipase
VSDRVTTRFIQQVALVLLTAVCTVAQAAPVTWKALLERPRPEPAQRIPYGPDALQHGELWMPDGPGPHPVVVLIHGGCWKASLPGPELLAHIAEDLRKNGLAVWSITYRRIGHDGGGWPGTFLDVAAAVDSLRTVAGEHPLDLDRVVLTGHSAGGHLALWAAGRPRLAPGTRNRGDAPLSVRGVVTLAGIVDLEGYAARGNPGCADAGTISALTGSAEREGEDPYLDTSPRAMVPFGLPVVLVSGDLDRVVDVQFGRDFAAATQAAGDDRVVVLELEASGHFELIDPTSSVWPRIRSRIQGLLD